MRTRTSQNKTRAIRAWRRDDHLVQTVTALIHQAHAARLTTARSTPEASGTQPTLRLSENSGSLRRHVAPASPELSSHTVASKPVGGAAGSSSCAHRPELTPGSGRSVLQTAPRRAASPV